MMDWFTADTHFGHRNIITHCNRPFADECEMDEQLLDNINLLVAPSDTLYHLGDFARYHRTFAAYRDRIRCRNIVLVLGNHDPQTRSGQPKNRFLDMFSRVYLSLQIAPLVGGARQPMVLSHYAMRTWNRSHRGSWNLFGHSHGMLPDNGSKSFDVGVDAHNYRPISMVGVAETMSARIIGDDGCCGS